MESAVMSSTVSMLVPSSGHDASPTSDRSSPLIDESATDELVMLDTVDSPPCDVVRDNSLDCHFSATWEKPVNSTPLPLSPVTSPQFLVHRASATASPALHRACEPTANLQRRIVVIPRATNSPTRVGVAPKVIKLQRCLPLSPLKNSASTISSAQLESYMSSTSTNRLPGRVGVALSFSDTPISVAAPINFPGKNGNIALIKIPNGNSAPATSGISSFEPIKRIVPLCKDSLSKDSDVTSPAKCVEFLSRPIGTGKPVTLSCIKVQPTSDLAVQLLRNKSLNSSSMEKMESAMRNIRANVESPAVINVVPRNCVDFPVPDVTVDSLSVVCPDVRSGETELGALSPHVKCTTHVAVCVPASLHSTSLGGSCATTETTISPLKIAPLLYGTSHISADHLQGTSLKFGTVDREPSPAAVRDAHEVVPHSVADPSSIQNTSETNDLDCVLIDSFAGDENSKTPTRRCRRREKPTPSKNPANGIVQLDGTNNGSIPDAAEVPSPDNCSETLGKTSDNYDSDSDSVVIVDVDLQEPVSKICIPKPCSPRSAAAEKVILLNHRTELTSHANDVKSDAAVMTAAKEDGTPPVEKRRRKRKPRLEARDLEPEAGRKEEPVAETLTAAVAVKSSRRLKAGKRKKNDDFDWLQKRRRKTAAEKRREVEAAMVMGCKPETVSSTSDVALQVSPDANEFSKNEAQSEACSASKTARVSARRRQKPKTWTDDMSLPLVVKRPRVATRRKKMTDTSTPASVEDKKLVANPTKEAVSKAPRPSIAGKTCERTVEKQEPSRDTELTGGSSPIAIRPAKSAIAPPPAIGSSGLASSGLPVEKTLTPKTENRSMELQIQNEDGELEDVLVMVIDISSSESEADDDRADDTDKDEPTDDLTKYLLGNSSLKDVMAAQSTSASENPTPVKRSPRKPQSSPSRSSKISTDTATSSKTKTHAQKALDFVLEDGRKSDEVRPCDRLAVPKSAEVRPLPALTDSRVATLTFKIPAQQQQQHTTAEPPALTDSRQIKTSPDIPALRENPSETSADAQKSSDKSSTNATEIAASADVKKSSDKTSSKGKEIASRRRPAGKLARKTLLKRKRRKNANTFDDEFSLIEKDASRVVNRLKRVYGSRPGSSSQRRSKNASASGSKSHRSETAEASSSSTAAGEYNGPVIRIRGPKENPSSCTVIAAIHDVEEDTKGKKSARKTSTFDASCYPTSFNLNDAVPWECVFCHRGSAYRTLGDLFGPYYARPSHIPSSAALTPPAGSGTKPELTAGQPATSKPESSSRKRDSTPTRVPSARKKAAAATPDASRKRVPLTSSARSPSPTKSAATAGPVIPSEIWVHEDCVIWTNGTYITKTGQLEGLENAILLSSQMVCAGCQSNGATLGCFARGCNTAYHYLCARDAGCSLEDENFRVFCAKHKNKKMKLI